MKVRNKEKKRVRFRFSFLLLFILTSFVICFTLYMNNEIDIESRLSFLFDVNEGGENSVAEVYAEADYTGENTAGIINPVRKSARAQEEYFRNALFIGTSVVRGLSDCSLVPGESIITDTELSIPSINDITVTYNNEETDVFSVVYDKMPVSVYLMFENIAAASVDEALYFDSYSNFIDSIKRINEDVSIYLISVLPVKRESETQTVSNAVIDRHNTKLYELANTKGISYLDINTEFKGNDGRLPSSVNVRNSERLNEDAYREISEYILTHIHSKE